MEKVAIIGLDLAKKVFQADGATSDGSVAFPKNPAVSNKLSADFMRRL